MSQPLLTLDILAIVDRTFAKDLSINERGLHEVPTLALRNMVNHPRFGLAKKASGSTIMMAVRVLIHYMVIQLTRAEYRGHARCYRYLKSEWYGHVVDSGCGTSFTRAASLDRVFGALDNGAAPLSPLGLGGGHHTQPFSPINQYREGLPIEVGQGTVQDDDGDVWGEVVDEESEIFQIEMPNWT